MPADRFPSLDVLKAYLGPNGYRIRQLDRQSQITVISPHGGFIETGTSSIARAVAGKGYNFFDFQGLFDPDRFDMHITATNFRDPDLTALLAQSSAAIAIHGMHRQGHKTIYLGGLNREYKSLVQAELVAANFSVNADPPQWRGEHPQNIVNLVRHRGVQLELSSELLTDFYVGKRFYRCGRSSAQTVRFDNLVRALRAATRLYLRTLKSSGNQA